MASGIQVGSEYENSPQENILPFVTLSRFCKANKDFFIYFILNLVLFMHFPVSY
jgi:hypothetical protein